MNKYKVIEDVSIYYSEERKRKVLDEIFFNAYRTIMNVYIFKHFDEYIKQLKASNNEDKREEYWNASYYEKLIDYIKISVAFENYNKAKLLQNGILVHKIKNANNKDLVRRQKEGKPVFIEEFLGSTYSVIDPIKKEYYLGGFLSNFQTINYSDTLNDFYQKYIGLDPQLLFELKKINERRNRLHFYTEFKGAYVLSQHIAKWTFIKENSERIIKAEAINN